MHGALRIIDAAFNRAREALRTLEDIARFSLDDAPLTERAKTLRHDLAASLAGIDPVRRLAARDTPGDVGTSIKAAGEFDRPSLDDVAAAAGGRLTEALRSLEEAAKCVPGADARTIERVRYESYSLERDLRLRLAGGRSAQWALCVLITEALCTHLPWDQVARRALEGGADCLQLREKCIDGGVLVERAETLVRMARPFGAAVIVNDRADVAMLAGAAGVHVGRHDLSVPHVRRLAGASLMVGVSTASPEEAAAARAAGADYCGVGPMFPTSTKHKPVIAGPAALKACIEMPGMLPHLAIGGITTENIESLVAVGVRGVAVSSCVCGSTSPEETCRRLRAALRS